MTTQPASPSDRRVPPWSDRVLWRRRGITVSAGRLVQVVAIAGLAVLALALPYLTLQYLNQTVQLTTDTENVIGAGTLIGEIGPSNLPSFYRPEYGPMAADRMNQGLNLIAFAAGAQLIGSVVALVCCGGLLADEINRFFWWPLHVAGYPLVAAVVPLLIGVEFLRDSGALISIGPAVFPGALAGVAAVVVSIRARQRIDTYRGF